MAHFAKLSEDNLVLAVEVVADANTTNDSNIEDEATGVTYLQNTHGWTSWKKCSYNTHNGKYWNQDNTEAEDQSKSFRKNYPSVGWSYNSTIDGFIPAKPEGMTSWIINTTTGHWEAPVAYPTIETTMMEIRIDLMISHGMRQMSDGLQLIKVILQEIGDGIALL